MPKYLEHMSPFYTIERPAAKQHVLRAMKTIDARLRKRLVQAKKEDSKRAVLNKKLALANIQIYRQSGVDLSSLSALAKTQWRQRRRTMKLRAKVPSRSSEVPALERSTIVVPPYSYDWSATGYIDYAPGTLSAYATRNQGIMSFDIESSPSSHQVNRSFARAAVGTYFKPSLFGLVSVKVNAPIDVAWSYSAQFAGADTRGWAGFLVQSFNADNSLSTTPVNQQQVLFDEGYDGHAIEFNNSYTLTVGDGFIPVPILPGTPDVPGTELTATFWVNPQQWYAIWVWCGGDIHAEGWQTILGVEKGSDAAAQMVMWVPSILLEFEPGVPKVVS
jgi:hypothetical protein